MCAATNESLTPFDCVSKEEEEEVEKKKKKKWYDKIANADRATSKINCVYHDSVYAAQFVDGTQSECFGTRPSSRTRVCV